MIHSYPWYPSDWRSSQDVLALTAEARDIYRNLLDVCWMDGSLPKDEKVLIKLSLADAKEWKRSGDEVVKLFVEIDGRLHHPKVDERRPELVEWHEQKRAAGRKSGIVRSNGKRTNVQRAFERNVNERSTDVDVSFEPSASASASASLTHTQSVCAADLDGQTSDRFDEFWGRYPHKVGRDQACRMWVSRVTVENVAEVFAGLERWECSDQWERGIVAKPVNWLSESAWRDTPMPSKRAAVYVAPTVEPTAAVYACERCQDYGFIGTMTEVCDCAAGRRFAEQEHAHA